MGFAILGILVVAILATLGYRSQRNEPHVVSALSTSRNPIAPASTLPSEAVVHIVGAVRNPGVYELKSDVRVEQAVQAAGGFTQDADRESVNLASRIADGQQIRIPKKGEASSIAVPTGAAKVGKIASGTVSLNSATVQELESLPGVGPATAQKIVDFRASHGAFASIDQLREVGGIGEKKLARLSPYLRL